MKIKEVIEDLKLKMLKKKKRKGKKKKKKKKKNKRVIVKNSKNISSTFSCVVGSVGSVHFQIVSWCGLYFSRSIGPFLCSWY